MDSPLSADEIRNMLINPYYAIVIDDSLFGDEGIKGDRVKWVEANKAFIQKVGPEKWLTQLLEILSVPASGKKYSDISNPFEAAFLADTLQGEHPPLVTGTQWVKANVKLWMSSAQKSGFGGCCKSWKLSRSQAITVTLQAGAQQYAYVSSGVDTLTL
ncbi:MAG: hypothetical protein WDN27_05370 [Candidatus Saccharibacteria bacterium]